MVGDMTSVVGVRCYTSIWRENREEIDVDMGL